MSIRKGETIVSGLLNPYQIGAIYISVDSTSPASLFGGTWTQILGKFLLPSDDVLDGGTIVTAGTYHINDTGGEATHTLTVSEIPAHQHKLASNSISGSGNAISVQSVYAGSDSNPTKFITGYTGGSQAHNNMPPYLVVYMWKRVP